jgi:hypothetical protein
VGAKGEEVEVAEEEEEAEEGRGEVVLWRCVAAEPGKTTAVFVRFIYKRSFCQDRLGTNIAKALQKECYRFLAVIIRGADQEPPPPPDNDEDDEVRALPDLSFTLGFDLPRQAQGQLRFAKTGSGQADIISTRGTHAQAPPEDEAADAKTGLGLYRRPWRHGPVLSGERLAAAGPRRLVWPGQVAKGRERAAVRKTSCQSTANCIIIDHFSAFEFDWSPRFSTLRDKNGWVRAKTA